MVPTFDLVPPHLPEGTPQYGATVGASSFRRGEARRGTVIAKATFELHPSGVARPVDPAKLEGRGALLARDVYHHAQRASSLRASREVVPYLPKAGVVLTGHACAVGGRPTTEMMVRLRLERDEPLIDKAVRVLGDRASSTRDRPAPFEKMPLLYERAWGGPRRADNPVGTGDEPTSCALPNLIHPDEAKRATGFGPLSPYWSERRRHLGEVDAASALSEHPEVPQSFEGHFYQPAPPDQQMDFLRGGERLTLEGMNPEHEKIVVELMEVTAHARVFLGGELRPVEMFADLLVIDADRLLCSIVWRGTFDLADAESVRVAAAITDPGVEVSWPEMLQADAGTGAASVPTEGLHAELSRRIRDGDSLEELDLTGAALRGFDFTGATLTSIDLSDADLRDSRLARVNLQGARLCGADLSGADVTGADLTDADLLRAKLDQTKLDGANLATAKLSEAIGRGASFDEAKLGKATLARGDWEGASFQRASMEHADLSGAKLSRATFEAASLVQARLSDAKGAEVDFTSCRLNRVRADRAELTQSSFSRAQGDASVWEGAKLHRCRFERASLDGASFVRAQLEGAQFVEAKLTNGRFREAEAPEASFRDANMSGAKLQRLTAPKAEFDGAKMEGADLGQSALEGASFVEANMVKTWLDRAVLSGANLADAELRQASLRSTTLRGAHLVRTQLDGADLRDADLSGARMQDASTEGARMAGANMEGVTRDSAPDD